MKGRLLLTVACGVALIGAGARSETALVGSAGGQSEQLAHTLFTEVFALTQVEPLVYVVSTEGARHGLGLADVLFPGRGGEGWSREVAAIQSPDRLIRMLSATLEADLAAEDLPGLRRFFSSDLGQRVADREVIARRDMLDADIELNAMQAAASLHVDATPRAAIIDGMIDDLDLVTFNVSGGLNANFAFYRGLDDGGALGRRMTESELLTMVWAQEDEIRVSTRKWLTAYLMLAYGPLTDDELRSYVDFLASPLGRRYNAALFRGFGAVFEATSYDLGRAAANFMRHQDI